MAEPSFESGCFLAAHCTQCGTEVLTYLGIGENGELSRSCLTCEATVLDGFRELEAADLIDLGYEVIAAKACGNGGGCSSGGCGMRKED